MALLFIPFVVGTFLFVVSLLALGIGAIVRRYGFRPSVFWWGSLLVAAGLAMWFNLWPTPTPTASCSTSPLPLYSYLAAPAPYVTGADTNARSRSQVDIYLGSFDRRRFELLQSAEYSEEGFSRVQDAYSILNNLAKIESGVDLGPLQDRINKLEDRLNELSKPGGSRLDAIRQRRGELQAYLADYSKRSKELQESAIPEFDKRFNEGLANVSLERVHGAISALDNALKAAINRTLSGDLDKRINAASELSAQLNEAASNEAASVVDLRESVVIKINDAEVTQIDASSLEIGSEVLRRGFQVQSSASRCSSAE